MTATAHNTAQFLLFFSFLGIYFLFFCFIYVLICIIIRLRVMFPYKHIACSGQMQPWVFPTLFPISRNHYSTFRPTFFLAFTWERNHIVLVCSFNFVFWDYGPLLTHYYPLLDLIIFLALKKHSNIVNFFMRDVDGAQKIHDKHWKRGVLIRFMLWHLLHTRHWV